MRSIDDGSVPARFEAANGITLRFVTREHDGAGYPTSSIRKGLLMSCGGVDLSEEGVGFGVPVLKQPRETIFPGNMRLTTASPGSVVEAEYDMNLVERLSLRTRPSLVSVALNAVREPLALLHRRYPFFRGLMSDISNAMRAAFGIRTTFERAKSRGIIRVTHRFDAAAGILHVRMEVHCLAVDGCTGLIIMNEHGAHFFDRYSDSTGCVRQGASIETWQEVAAEHATFVDSRHKVSFTLKSASGARLFRGRELVEGRLAWAGFGYLLPPDTKEFDYDVDIGARE